MASSDSPEPSSADASESATGDSETTLSDLRQIVRDFVAERNWQKFHAPKNLSMALAIEAAELMERFQWLDVAESRAVPPDSPEAEAIREEVADVFCYTLAIANELGFDLSQAFTRKMDKNRRKYPADEFRGRFGKDDPQLAEPPSGPPYEERSAGAGA